MITHARVFACAVGAALGLSACATADVGVQSNIQAEYEDTCDYPVGSTASATGAIRQFVVNMPGTGKDLAEILQEQNADELEARVQALEEGVKANARGKNLRQRLDSLQNSEYGKGLGGVTGRLFARTAVQATRKKGQFLRARNVVTTGQLLAYHYVPNGEGCLEVLMTRTITSGLGQAHTFRYKVTVFARFQVAVRDNTDSENVFPDADPMPIPASMADADGRNFQRKLWAKGANIKITRVETATGNNDFFLRGEGNSMYDVTEDSCIDMMFKTDPPETMPDGAGPPFYCLGRCDEPPIINTK